MISLYRCGSGNIEEYNKVNEFTDEKPYVANTYYVRNDKYVICNDEETISGTVYYELITTNDKTEYKSIDFTSDKPYEKGKYYIKQYEYVLTQE
jgi:phosphoserine aminotransferase